MMEHELLHALEEDNHGRRLSDLGVETDFTTQVEPGMYLE